eukprot:scaffold55257_cov17-Tisochrysis_lutea.AAC.1
MVSNATAVAVGDNALLSSATAAAAAAAVDDALLSSATAAAAAAAAAVDDALLSSAITAAAAATAAIDGALLSSAIAAAAVNAVAATAAVDGALLSSATAVALDLLLSNIAAIAVGAQVSNATAVYVRRPGMARKFRAQIICEGKMCDLALMTVEDDAFWLGPSGSTNGATSGPGPLKPLNFVDVPELQVPIAVAGVCEFRVAIAGWVSWVSCLFADCVFMDGCAGAAFVSIAVLQLEQQRQQKQQQQQQQQQQHNSAGHAGAAILTAASGQATKCCMRSTAILTPPLYGFAVSLQVSCGGRQSIRDKRHCLTSGLSALQDVGIIYEGCKIILVGSGKHSQGEAVGHFGVI